MAAARYKLSQSQEQIQAFEAVVLLSRKVMQVQPLTLTENQFWKGFPFLFGSCHENDSQLVECLAGLLEPLPVEIGLEKMQMVIRQGAAKVGLLAHWKHKTPSWNISFPFVGILQNLPGIWLIWIADSLFFGYTFSRCRVWQLTMSAGHWCSWSWVRPSTPASRWGNSAFRRSKEFRRVVKWKCCAMCEPGLTWLKLTWL